MHATNGTFSFRQLQKFAKQGLITTRSRCLMFMCFNICTFSSDSKNNSKEETKQEYDPQQKSGKTIGVLKLFGALKQTVYGAFGQISGCPTLFESFVPKWRLRSDGSTDTQKVLSIWPLFYSVFIFSYVFFLILLCQMIFKKCWDAESHGLI